MTKLFVSYSQDDQEVVQLVVKKLQDLGLDVWIDKRAIMGGARWSTQITKAITDCDFFLLFVSSASIKSDGVSREVAIAHANDKKIIPLRLEEVGIPMEWSYEVTGIQWIEYARDDWLARLLVAFGNLQASNNKVPDHTDSSIKNNPLGNYSTSEIPEPNVNSLESATSVIAKVIEIFDRDFVLPKECDNVISLLKSLTGMQTFDPQSIHLQYAFEARISKLSSRIVEFRKICQAETPLSESEKKSILQDAKRLWREL